MELTLTTSVRYVSRVGPVMARRLKKLGIETVADLLFYPPFRYNDFSLVSEIAKVRPGETVTIKGTVMKIQNFYTKTGKKIQEAEVADDSGKIPVIWFNQPFLLRVLEPGSSVSLSGRISWFGHRIVLSSPQYEVIKDARSGPSLHTGRLVPVYPEISGVTSKWLRGRIDFVLKQMLTKIPEHLPSGLVWKYQLPPLPAALAAIHFPKTLDEAKEGRDRLAFDELFLWQLRAFEERRKWEKTKLSFALTVSRKDVDSLIGSLPFRLTGDQKAALEAILADLSRPIAMNRLLEGDVGSGKTVVATIAMYVAYRNGLTSLIMAPTQILAEQHYQTISKLLRPLGVNVGLVTGGGKTNYTLLRKSNILVGTHALLYKNFSLSNVGLVIIDEQQRFGVEQRAKLTAVGDKFKTPHLLTMTATPIPRTMALTIFGNLDLSVLNQMPLGRQKVKTWVVPAEKRESAYAWIAKQLNDTGGQAFIICPLIEESETLSSVKAVTSEFERLKKVFPQFSIGLLHGRLKPTAKIQAIERFRNQKDRILLATPVVEVGIDIPNAMIMVIEAAERFGLGQLHQLRGRVGRGGIAAFCLLFTEDDSETTFKRLGTLETVFSGPKLAEIDLKLRGPGELFGTRQHGLPILTFANLSDAELILKSSTAVKETTELDPDLSTFPLLREKLKTSKIKMISQD